MAGKSSLRAALYRAARILGDLEAIRKGRIGRRVANHAIGRFVVSKLWLRGKR